MKRKIIPLNCTNRIFLSPMEEINDPAFRLLCKDAGAGLTWTGLSSPLNPKKLELPDKPVLQIFGTTTKGIASFMKKYDRYVSGWDFNLGCPAKTAKKQGHGSYLNDPKIIEKIIKEMRENTKKSLTIKIRESPISYELLRIAQNYCDAITIHPRTKEQGYSGMPDLTWARAFKEKSKIPVIYSGNVDDKNYKKFLKFFDYVMIGRNAIGRPQIFSKITKTRYNKTFKDYLKLAKNYNVPWRIIKNQAMNFTKERCDAKKLRLKIYNSKTLNGLEKIFN